VDLTGWRRDVISVTARNRLVAQQYYTETRIFIYVTMIFEGADSFSFMHSA
jgi:hypothetical protein